MCCMSHELSESIAFNTIKCFVWRYAIVTKGTVIFLVFTNKFVIMVLYLSFSFRYLVEWR